MLGKALANTNQDPFLQLPRLRHAAHDCQAYITDVNAEVSTPAREMYTNS